MRQFVRQSRDNRERILQFRTLDRDNHSRLIGGANIETSYSACIAAPKWQDRMKCARLIGDDFEIDLPFIDLHVIAYSLEHHVDGFIRGFVRVGEVLGDWKNDLGFKHP